MQRVREREVSKYEFITLTALALGCRSSSVKIIKMKIRINLLDDNFVFLFEVKDKLQKVLFCIYHMHQQKWLKKISFLLRN